MPNPSSYLVMVIIGFFLGILWGVLTIGSYTKLKDAVARNDSVEAQAQAKKIRTVFIIGLVINIFAFFGYIAQGALS